MGIKSEKKINQPRLNFITGKKKKKNDTKQRHERKSNQLLDRKAKINVTGLVVTIVGTYSGRMI